MTRRIPLAPPALAAVAFFALSLAAATPSVRAQQAERPSLELGDELQLYPLVQYRPRFIAHGGRDFAPGGNFDAVGHRARLGVEIAAFEWLRARVRVQDVRLWGEETSTLFDSSANGFDLHEAWVELRGPWGLSLRVGRQVHELEQGRIVGGNNWQDPGRTFDGVLLRAAPGELRVQLFWARLGEQDAATRDAAGKPLADSDLAYAWLRYQALSWLRPSLLVLYDRHSGSERHRVTFGGQLGGTLWGGLLGYRAELLAQRGRAAGRDFAGLLAAGRLRVAPPLPLRPELVAFVDYLSGDDPKTPETQEAFDNLVGNGHRFYGFMDIFRNIPTQTDEHGLVDVGVRAVARPAKGLSLRLDWHHFVAPAQVLTTAGGRRALGDELDLTVTYRVNRFLGVQSGFGVYFPTSATSCLFGPCRESPSTEAFGYLLMNLRI